MTLKMTNERYEIIGKEIEKELYNINHRISCFKMKVYNKLDDIRPRFLFSKNKRIRVLEEEMFINTFIYLDNMSQFKTPPYIKKLVCFHQFIKEYLEKWYFIEDVTLIEEYRKMIDDTELYLKENREKFQENLFDNFIYKFSKEFKVL